MKIFLTGSTGFIGKHLVEQLIAKGNNITVNLYNDESSPFTNDVKTYHLGKQSITTDINYLRKESFDGIIHLASLVLTVHNPEDAVRLIDSNVQFSTYILECAAQAKIDWFINTGTFWQNYQNADYSPVNLYAATKQAFENIAKYYIETNQIRFVTLRLFDTFGPNDSRPKIFNLWNKIAKSGETLDMSPGEQIIDISYIDDIVKAFIQLAHHLENNNQDINNGSIYALMAEKRHTLKELAIIFEKTTKQKLNINWGAKPYRIREAMNPWENGKTIPGWKPEISIQEGIIKLFSE